MTYTQAVLVGGVITVLLDLVVLRTRLLTTKTFWASYAIIVFFQLITNGVLTGREVVLYDESQITGLRIVSAPVEDLAFGFSMVTQTLCWWVWWGRRGVQNTPVRLRPRTVSRRGRTPVPQRTPPPPG